MTDDSSGDSHTPLFHYRHHDDYEELAKTVAIVLADEERELDDVFESRISGLIDRIGIEPSFFATELAVLRETTYGLRQFIRGQDGYE